MDYERSFRQKHLFTNYFCKFLLKRYRFNTTFKKMIEKYPHLTETKNQCFEKMEKCGFDKYAPENGSDFLSFL